MSYPKKEGYVPAHERCSHFAGVLTHPVRIHILYLLVDRSLTHEEICAAVPLCDSTVSHHLRMLLERGLIRYEEQHPWILYSLDEDGLCEMRTVFTECMEEIWGSFKG